MNARSKSWFEAAKAAGIPTSVAYLGSTVIDSFEDYWKHQISDENLAKMIRFGLQHPEAATHRWSLISGPCPWVAGEEEEKKLRANPKYSALDFFEEQRR